MLQVAERSTGVKRKALLVAEVPPIDAAAEVEDAYEQKAFTGEAFDRMRADPDLVRARRRLMMGVATVVGMVLVVTVWSLLSHWGLFRSGQIQPASPMPVVSSDYSVGNSQNISPSRSGPVDFEQLVKQRKAESGVSNVETPGQE